MKLLPNGKYEITNKNTGEKKIVSQEELPKYNLSAGGNVNIGSAPDTSNIQKTLSTPTTNNIVGKMEEFGLGSALNIPGGIMELLRAAGVKTDNPFFSEKKKEALSGGIAPNFVPGIGGVPKLQLGDEKSQNYLMGELLQGASWATPFGKGKNFATKATIPGGFLGGVNEYAEQRKNNEPVGPGGFPTKEGLGKMLTSGASQAVTATTLNLAGQLLAKAFGKGGKGPGGTPQRVQNKTEEEMSKIGIQIGDVSQQGKVSSILGDYGTSAIDVNPVLAELNKFKTNPKVLTNPKLQKELTNLTEYVQNYGNTVVGAYGLKGNIQNEIYGEAGKELSKRGEGVVIKSMKKTVAEGLMDQVEMAIGKENYNLLRKYGELAARSMSMEKPFGGALTAKVAAGFPAMAGTMMGIPQVGIPITLALETALSPYPNYLVRQGIGRIGNALQKPTENIVGEQVINKLRQFLQGEIR